MVHKWFKSINNRLLDYYGITALFIVWQLAPKLGWIDPQFIPPPSAIVLAGWKLLFSGDLLIHVAASLERILAGLSLAIIVAVPLGFILGGWFPRAAKFLHPLLEILGQVNAFSLFPVFILFFGIGEVAKLSIIFWSCIWPILFTTISGVQHVDPIFIKSAKSMGASRWTIFYKIVLPGAAPAIFTGIRIGSTVAFLMLIAAEMIGASAGLGWLIHNSSVNNLIPQLFAASVMIALLGTGLNYFIHWLETTVVTWQEEQPIG